MLLLVYCTAWIALPQEGCSPDQLPFSWQNLTDSPTSRRSASQKYVAEDPNSVPLSITLPLSGLGRPPQSTNSGWREETTSQDVELILRACTVYTRQIEMYTHITWPRHRHYKHSKNCWASSQAERLQQLLSQWLKDVCPCTSNALLSYLHVAL